MKRIKTNNGEILVVKVPKESKEFGIGGFSDMSCLYYYSKKFPKKTQGLNTVDGQFLKAGQYKVFGKLSDLKDKDLEEFIEFEDFFDDFEGWRHYKSYLKEDKCELINSCCLDTIKDSFKSLLKSNDIDWKENETLIIKIL